jgi:hypothetical protein
LRLGVGLGVAAIQEQIAGGPARPAWRPRLGGAGRRSAARAWRARVLWSGGFSLFAWTTSST